jgi:DNA-binding transcriptional MerR regulator
MRQRWTLPTDTISDTVLGLPPPLSTLGWRVYDEAAVRRIRKIAELIGHGLTIEGVKQLQPCLELHDLSICDNPSLALETYRARLAVLDERLAKLQHHRDELAQLVRALRPGQQ